MLAVGDGVAFNASLKTGATQRTHSHFEKRAVRYSQMLEKLAYHAALKQYSNTN